jgi:hypothetical protein
MGFRGQFALQKSLIAHVRFGSKADMCNAPTHVRFAPNSDRESGFPHKVMSGYSQTGCTVTVTPWNADLANSRSK